MMKCAVNNCGYYNIHNECATVCKQQGYSRIITNADCIRAMPDKELAKLLLDGCRGSDCDNESQNELGSVNCLECRIKWLKSPAEQGKDGK